MGRMDANASLEALLRSLRLPGFVAHYEEVAVRAAKHGWSFGQYLRELAQLEKHGQDQRRIERLIKRSRLPLEKTMTTLDLSRLPQPVQRQLTMLCDGQWVDRAENCLAFGLPGRGKSHAFAAIGHELVRKGISVLFIPAFLLVQRLLVAKRELTLEQELRRLDRFAVVCVDDIGYVQNTPQETEVLFTFFAERYERRSLMITSNLVFSQWDRLFPDRMTAVAAIDRLVHHSTILEFTGESFRAFNDKRNGAGSLPQATPSQPTSSARRCVETNEPEEESLISKARQ